MISNVHRATSMYTYVCTLNVYYLTEYGQSGRWELYIKSDEEKCPPFQIIECWAHICRRGAYIYNADINRPFNEQTDPGEAISFADQRREKKSDELSSSFSQKSTFCN